MPLNKQSLPLPTFVEILEYPPTIECDPIVKVVHARSSMFLVRAKDDQEFYVRRASVKALR